MHATRILIQFLSLINFWQPEKFQGKGSKEKEREKKLSFENFVAKKLISFFLVRIVFLNAYLVFFICATPYEYIHT